MAELGKFNKLFSFVHESLIKLFGERLPKESLQKFTQSTNFLSKLINKQFMEEKNASAFH